VKILKKGLMMLGLISGIKLIFLRFSRALTVVKKGGTHSSTSVHKELVRNKTQRE